MSELIIKNRVLEVSILTEGAQIKSVKKDGKEYMWEGDPKVWGKHAPVLFPICGNLKDGKYSYKGNTYYMKGHGFSGSADFSVREHTEDTLTLFITHNEETKKCYPFEFDFEVKFILKGSSVKVEYNVTNLGEESLYYSTGCHEAYACPEGIEEYEIHFPEALNLSTYLPVEGNVLADEPVPFRENCKVLTLCEEFFDNDSLCFKNMGAYYVELKHKGGRRTIKLEFPGFDYFVVWHMPGAPYVCLEPWKGFPDFESTDGDFTKKDGISKVEPGEKCINEHTITFE